MRSATGLIIFLIVFIVPKNAQAIIFVPALILIPIAKILAVLLAGFSLPAAGVGAMWGKLTKHSVKRGIVYGIVALLILVFIVGIILKIIHPDRPLF